MQRLLNQKAGPPRLDAKSGNVWAALGVGILAGIPFALLQLHTSKKQQKSGRRAILPPSTPPLIESSPPESLGCIREKEGKDEDSFEYAKAQIFLKDETQRHLLVEGRTRRFPVSLPSDLDRSMEAVELITTLASTPRDRSCSPRPLQCSVCADDMMEFIKGVYKELVGLGEALDGAEDPVAQVRATLEEAEISFGQLEQLLATMRAAKADLEKELNQRLGRILYLEEKLEKERTRRASLVSSMQTEAADQAARDQHHTAILAQQQAKLCALAEVQQQCEAGVRLAAEALRRSEAEHDELVGLLRRQRNEEARRHEAAMNTLKRAHDQALSLVQAELWQLEAEATAMREQERSLQSLLEKKTAEQEEARVQAGTLADELDAMRRTRQAEAEVLMESLESALKRSRELEERLGQVEAALLGAETDRKEAGGRAALEAASREEEAECRAAEVAAARAQVTRAAESQQAAMRDLDAAREVLELSGGERTRLMELVCQLASTQAVKLKEARRASEQQMAVLEARMTSEILRVQKDLEAVAGKEQSLQELAASHVALDSEQRARISALEEEVDVLKKLRAEEVRELEEQLAGTKAVFEQERSRADKMEKGLQVMRQRRQHVIRPSGRVLASKMEEEDDGDLFCLPVTELARVTALLLAIQSSKVGAQPREAAAASLLLAVSERRGGLLEILGNAGGVKTLLEVSAQGRKGKSAASYKSSPLLRCTAMEILEHLASDADICSHILAEGGLSALARLVDRWGGATADERAAAAAVLCCISAHPWCWRQMTSEGAVRSLVSALDTDRSEDRRLVQSCSIACSRLACHGDAIKVMQSAGGRWLLGVTTRSKVAGEAACRAAACALERLEDLESLPMGPATPRSPVESSTSSRS